MADSNRYYMLIASLPALTLSFEAPRPPISRPRLEARLNQLAPADLAVIQEMETFLRWARQTGESSDAAVNAHYAALLASSANAFLTEIVSYRMDMRTLIAALRRRARGLGPPGPADGWRSQWVRAIRQNWTQPDFRLAPVFPILPELARLLREGDSVGLDRAILRAVWDRLSQMEPRDPFSFEAILIYLCKWDVVDRSAAYDGTAASLRFTQLVEEALEGHVAHVA